MARRRSTRDDVVYGLLVACETVGRRLPLSVARGIGSGLGRFANLILRRERKKATRRVAFAFPELSPERQRRIVREMFVHLGKSLLEITWLPNLTAASLGRTTTIEGSESLRRAFDAGRGVVLFTGHCGNWEWLAATIALSGVRMNVVARDIDDERLNRFIVRSRARHGVKSIGRGSTSSARELLSTLRNGDVLGVLIDQNIRAEAVEVPFFDHPASTPVGPAKLAIRSGAMVISAFIERRGNQQVVRFSEPLETHRDDNPAELTARMTLEIEQQIRRVPEQWVWIHDRWRKRTTT